MTIRVKFIFNDHDDNYSQREYSFNSGKDTPIDRCIELLKLVHSAGKDAIILDAKISNIIVIE